MPVKSIFRFAPSGELHQESISQRRQDVAGTPSGISNYSTYSSQIIRLILHRLFNLFFSDYLTYSSQIIWLILPRLLDLLFPKVETVLFLLSTFSLERVFQTSQYTIYSCPVSAFFCMCVLYISTIRSTSPKIYPTHSTHSADLPLLPGDDMYDSVGTRPVYNFPAKRRNSSCACPGSVAEEGQGIQVAYPLFVSPPFF